MKSTVCGIQRGKSAHSKKKRKARFLCSVKTFWVILPAPSLALARWDECTGSGRALPHTPVGCSAAVEGKVTGVLSQVLSIAVA